MCGRYIQVKSVEVVEKRFNVRVAEGQAWEPSFNIAPGDYAPVITDSEPGHIQLMQFGLTPFWAKKPMYLFNARAEGDRNSEDDPHYRGSKDIINKPAFRKPIRSQRCLVIADAFYEGTTAEKLDKPYLVYLKNKQAPFAFAGLWDTWKNPETGEEINSFAIVTTVANSLLQRIPHHRSPVILPQGKERTWLSNRPLTDITHLLEPFPGELMNAYPVGTAVKNSRNKAKELIAPLGAPIDAEMDYKENVTLKLLGMGRYKQQ